MVLREEWTWDPDPWQLFPISTPVVKRGLAELKPRRADIEKICSSLIRQSVFQSEQIPKFITTFLGKELQNEFQEDILVRDFPENRIMSPSAPNFWKLLNQNAQSHIFLTVGESTPKPNTELVDLGSVVRRLDPAQTDRYLKFLMKAAVETYHQIKIGLSEGVNPFIIQERPGKISYLEIEDLSVKATIKKIQTIQQSPKVRDKLNETSAMPLGGWGLASMSFGSPRNGNSIKIAAGQLTMHSKRGSLDLLDALISHLEVWYERKTNQPFSGIDKGYIICQSLPILAYLSEKIGLARIGSGVGIDRQFPDQLYGWSPLITCFDFMSQSGNNFLLDMSNFPKVHLAAIWR